MGHAKRMSQKSCEKPESILAHCITFWRHTGLPLHWKLRIYNPVFVPMIAYGMESAALTTQDLHRIEAFPAQSLRKMHRILYYTKEPDVPTMRGSCRGSQKGSAEVTLGGAVCSSSLPLGTGTPEPPNLQTPSFSFCIC